MNTDMAIGRTFTVTVSGEDAVLSTVNVKESNDESVRVKCIGPGEFHPKTWNHIQNILVPLLDRILRILGLPPKSFDISVNNIHATSLYGIAPKVSGYSADLALFVAMLSSALDIPIPQDVVSTGHISSPDGDVSLVKSIKSKLSAAQETSGIRAFIYPSLESDRSIETVLSEEERSEVEEALSIIKDSFRTIPVNNIAEVLEFFFRETDIITSSLTKDYFGNIIPTDLRTSIEKSMIRYLVNDLDARFWKCFEDSLKHDAQDEAKKLLLDRVNHHIRNKMYPCNFGRKLYQIFRSIPPNVLKPKNARSFLPIQSWSRFIQYAQQNQESDVFLFLRAINPQYRIKEGATETQEIPISPSMITKATVDLVVLEISKRNLTHLISHPIYKARSSFFEDVFTTEDTNQFYGCIESFFMHLLNHTRQLVSPIEEEDIRADALNLLEKAFRDQGGVKLALLEAREGVHGGIPYILTQMAEQLIKEQKQKYVNFVLKRILDPTNPSQKVEFIRHFFDKIKPILPEGTIEGPPEWYVNHCDQIVLDYVCGIDSLNDNIKRYQ